MAEGDIRDADVVPSTMEEAQQMTDAELGVVRAKKIGRIVAEVNALLIRENMTLADWGAVVEVFSQRIGEQISSISVKDLK